MNFSLIWTRSFGGLILLTGTLCASPVSYAFPIPKGVAWVRINGNPLGNCFRTYNETHFPAAFSLNAFSTDKRVSWAVTASEQGLSVSACHLREDGSAKIATEKWWKVGRGSQVATVYSALESATNDLFSDGDVAALSSNFRRYSVEARDLKEGLEPALKTMLSDAKRRFPRFLKDPPPITVTVH